MELNKIISNKEVDEVFEGTNFGSRNPRQMLKEGLLKRACGYYTGHTIKCIMIDLELTNKKQDLTRKGMDYLYECHRND